MSLEFYSGELGGVPILIAGVVVAQGKKLIRRWRVPSLVFCVTLTKPEPDADLITSLCHRM
jgi:hypothetical protein